MSIYFVDDTHLVLQGTNPFDLFEAFFGSSMGGFAGMDGSGFGASRRSTVSKGEDLR